MGVGGAVVGDEAEAAHQFVSRRVLGRLTKYLSLSGQLRGLALQLNDPALKPGDTLLLSLVSSVPFGGAPGEAAELSEVGLSGLLIGVPSLAVFLPVPWTSIQCRSEVLREAAHPHTRAGLVQVDGLPTRRIRVVLHGHDLIISLPWQMLDSAGPRTRGNDLRPGALDKATCSRYGCVKAARSPQCAT